MVGTCIQVARGILPAEILDFALTLPYYFDLPMAPAVGLLVADSGFKGSYGMVSAVNLFYFISEFISGGELSSTSNVCE